MEEQDNRQCTVVPGGRGERFAIKDVDAVVDSDSLDLSRSSHSVAGCQEDCRELQMFRLVAFNSPLVIDSSSLYTSARSRHT